MPRKPAATSDLVIALGLAAFAGLIRLPLLGVPFERDDASYALLSLEALHGRFPYRDFVTMKPPLLYILYLPLALIGGADAVIQRVVGLVFPVASTLLVWRLGIALTGNRRAGIAAGVLFAIASSDPSLQGCILNAELLMLPPAIASVLLWRRTLERNDTAAAAGAGAWLGAAVLVKEPAITQAGLVLVAWTPGFRVRRPWRLAAAAALGAVAVGAACLAALAAAGLLGPAAGCFREGLRYTAALPAGLTIDLALRAATIPLATQGWIWLLALIGLGSAWAPGARRLVVLWFILGIAGVLMGRRAFPHYGEQVVPPLAVAAGAGAARLIDSARRTARGRALRAAASVAVAGWAAYSFLHLAPLLGAGAAEKARILYPENRFLECARAGEWIRDNAPPGRVFVAGSEPEIPLIAGRSPAGRYPFVYHLTVDSRDFDRERRDWLAELDDPGVTVAVFASERTAWIDVYTSLPVAIALQREALSRLEGRRWRLAADIPPCRIYLRR